MRADRGGDGRPGADADGGAGIAGGWASLMRPALTPALSREREREYTDRSDQDRRRCKRRRCAPLSRLRERGRG
ncbi:protein of unknown function [Cupriavidus taiwanensis]|nr:hypothetical protein CBM2606_A90502 [Cupriavidus taiwanensis]SPA41972.1 protein of unknown function [Cupriavidus taiwanensis]